MQVTKVRVTALVGNTYHARVHMSTSGKDACTNEVDIDARPSDAINLAVRFNAPVYVNKQVGPLQRPCSSTAVRSKLGFSVKDVPHATPCQAVGTVAHG